MNSSYQTANNVTDQIWNSDDLARMNQVLRHRIRNFVSGIKASISFLEQELRPVLSAPQLEYFPLIIRECDELAECTNRMNMLFDKLPVSEAETCQNLFLSLVEKIRSRFPSLELIVEMPETAASAIIQQKMCVSVIIQEGIINAAEASPGMPVNVSFIKEERTITITIKDSSKAILKSEDTEKFFLPFFTTKPRHLGLGLAIARRFAVFCGGSINLTPNKDRGGSVLTISLPLEPIPSTSA